MGGSDAVGFEQSYNPQIAVDQETILIVAHALSNHPNDKAEVEPTLTALSAALGVPAAMDNGYFSASNIAACENWAASLTMLLAPIPWAQCVWALPFLTVLVPLERYYDGRKQQHKSLTDWARQIIMQVRSWLPKRQLIVAADSSYATLELLAASQGLAEPVTIVTRLRLDVVLYAPTPPREPGRRSAPRKKGARQPNLAVRVNDPTTV